MLVPIRWFRISWVAVTRLPPMLSWPRSASLPGHAPKTPSRADSQTRMGLLTAWRTRSPCRFRGPRKGQFDVHAIDFVRRNPEGEFVGRLAPGGHRVSEGERALVLRSVEDVVVVLTAAVSGFHVRQSHLDIGTRVVLDRHRDDGDVTIGRFGAGGMSGRCAGTDLHGRGDVVSDCDFAALCGGGLATVGPLARVDLIGRGRL